MAPTPEPSLDDAPHPLRRPLPPRSWRERIEHLADATGTTPLRILAGGGAVALALGAGLWLTRPPASPVEVSLPYATTSSASLATTTTVPTVVIVHVAGAVRAPGVQELPTGSRVVDAVEAAGGVTGEADLSRVNLAAPLEDGERIYVPAIGEAPPPLADGSVSGRAPGAVPGPVNLNEADVAALDSLPGVGPATAAAIVEHRERIGGFTSVDQLLDVRGIGEAKLEALRDLVTV